jgi:hypothetical protein
VKIILVEVVEEVVLKDLWDHKAQRAIKVILVHKDHKD